MIRMMLMIMIIIPGLAGRVFESNAGFSNTFCTTSLKTCDIPYDYNDNNHDDDDNSINNNDDVIIIPSLVLALASRKSIPLDLAHSSACSLGTCLC
jgi:hypothetical protein